MQTLPIRNSNTGLKVSILLVALIFSLGLLVVPYFPSKVPASSGSVIIQSMIEVNGALFGFSAILVSILALNPKRSAKADSIFLYLFLVTGLFLVAVFFDVLDLANMGETIDRAYLTRDVLTPVFFALAFIYMSSQIYKESQQ